jgi:hypothetical protein
MRCNGTSENAFSKEFRINSDQFHTSSTPLGGNVCSFVVTLLDAASSYPSASKRQLLEEGNVWGLHRFQQVPELLLPPPEMVTVFPFPSIITLRVVL